MDAELGCPELGILQQLSLDQLSPAEAFPIQRHLAHCPFCSATLKELKEAAALITATAARPQSGGLQKFYQADLPDRPSRHRQDAAAARDAVRGSAATVMAPLSIGPGPHGFLAPPQEKDELGRLGNYRILNELGHGGMGLVFLAEDINLRRLVALKVMKPEQACDATFRQRFLQEGQVMASLHHDHLISIYQVDEDRGVPFLAMEYLQGESLEARLQRERPLPVAEIVRLAWEVAEGLAAAHIRGLIHRDIKPSNIWLESKDEGGRRKEQWDSSFLLPPSSLPRVKLLDFGLARLMRGQDQRLTQTGMVVGTPGYLAPEQASDKVLDERCDLFSLGCVVYEMATGQEPFRRSDTMATLMALALEQPTPPRQLNPHLPPVLAELIMWLLAKNPGDRPRSAQAVVQALATLEFQLELATRPPMASESRALEPTSFSNSDQRVNNGLSPLLQPVPEKTGWLGLLRMILTLLGMATVAVLTWWLIDQLLR